MSKMSTVSLEIQELLYDGLEPDEVAAALKIPLTWVYAAQELIESQDYGIPEYDE